MSSSAWAQLAETGGFGGEISISTGFYSIESNLNTHDDNKHLKDLGATNDAVNDILILPLGNISYTYGQGLNQQVYVGTSREDIATGTLAFEIGYKYQLLSGMIVNASILPTIMSGEVWEDPYKVSGERSTTDEDGNAFRLKLENIGGSKFTVDMAYATKDIDNDLLGEQYSSLRRGINAFYLKTDYKYMVDQTTMLKPLISFISADADGDANSFKGYGAELSYFKFVNRHQFALTASFDTRDYDAVNPVFNATRKDKEIGLFSAYEYENVMDWQDWSFISLAGFKLSDSNINFYDQDQFIISFGLNYQW